MQTESLQKLKRESEKLKLKQQTKILNNSYESKKFCQICRLNNHVTKDCRRNSANKKLKLNL